MENPFEMPSVEGQEGEKEMSEAEKKFKEENKIESELAEERRQQRMREMQDRKAS